MEYTNELIEELSSRIDRAGTSGQCYDLANEIFPLIGKFKTLLKIFPDGEFFNAVHDDLLSVISELEALHKRAETYAEDYEDQEYEEHRYGSYEDQVRATYRAGAL